MKTGEFQFKSQDGKEIYCYSWLPDQAENLQAVVQIAHGMAEHSLRYAKFAQRLTAEGIALYMNDHRGHGKTAGTVENVGFFAEENGWDLVVSDLHSLTLLVKENHPAVPLFLLGHSMGSLLARYYIFHHARDLSGVILSATGGDPGLLGKIGYFIAGWESRRKGKRHRSRLLMNLSFGNFNKAFKPNRTEFDWLNRDNAEVDKYIADPFCGGTFTSGFFRDILYGIGEINKASNIRSVPGDLPIYLYSGSMDPMGNKTRGVKQVMAAYQKAGIRDVSCKFYQGARHETLHEINREQVYRDVIDWIKKHLI